MDTLDGFEDGIGRRLSRRAGQGKGQFSNMIPALGGNIPAAKAFSRKQALFNEKASQYAKAGVISTPSYLRLESLATGSTSTFTFNTLETSGTKSVTEKRLKLNDTFTITDIAFYIQADAAAANAAPTDSQRATGRLYTYPNGNVSALPAATVTALEAVYNGFLSLRIDSTTFIDAYAMRSFYRVGTSQAGVGSTATNNVAISRDEWGLANYGRTELLPSIELNGQANIEWAINLPTAQNCAPAGNFYVNMVLVLFGFLNQGAANVQQRMQKRLRS
jgi:hypothetical protein